MENKAPDVSVIIVSWNSREYTLGCLASLQNPPGDPAVEIIVVDNASSDGTAEAVADRFPSVLLIRNQENVGFARANNQGLEISRGRYVCLVNSDVVVPEDCLPRLLEYMDAHPEIGLLGPKMLTPTGGAGYSVMRFPTPWNTLCCALGFSGFMMKEFNYDRTADVEVLTGWFWMARRSALDQVGGLDEQFFMYGEDIDWSQRFNLAGWRVVYYSEVGALHYGGASSKNAPARFYIEMRRANLQYYRKYHGRLSWLAYCLAVWSHELARVAAYGAIFLMRHSQRAEAAFKIDRSLRCMGWLVRAGAGYQAASLPPA